MLGGGPFAFADNGQACAVDDYVNGLIDCDVMQINIEVLATMRESGVIRGFKINAHQRQDRS